MKKNKKRTKLVWNDNTTDWEKFPLVILANAIKKQDWSKDITITIRGKSSGYQTRLYNTEKSLDDAKKEFRKKGWAKAADIKPDCITLKKQYKNNHIRIDIEWIFQETRCCISLEHPYQDCQDCFGHPKTKSKYIEGALERIKAALEKAILITEKEIIQKQEREQEKTEAAKYQSNLCKELGVTLTHRYKYTTFYSYEYHQGKHFGMNFRRIRPLEEYRKDKISFIIDEINGDFSIEEIKQLIKIIGGCPRAIVSRLTDKNT